MATYRELMSKYLKQGIPFSEAAKRAKAEQLPNAVRSGKKRSRVDASRKKGQTFYPSLDVFDTGISQARTMQQTQSRVVGNVAIKKGKIYYIDYTNGNVIEATI